MSSPIFIENEARPSGGGSASQVGDPASNYTAPDSNRSLPVGYKLTEVGIVPEDWQVRTMQESGSLSKGRGLLKEDIRLSGAVPAIPYTALYTDFSEVVDYGRIKWFVDDIEGTVVVDQPCVLIASSSNMVENTGRASALPGNECVAVGREVIIFRTDGSAAFASYLLSTSSFRKRTLALARGTTIKHLYPATFTDYKLCIPGLSEQHAIAEALSDVDGLLGALDALIAKKRAIKQAAMQQLLTGNTRLPGFSGEWEMKRLGELGQFLKGSGVARADAQSGPLPCVRYGEIYTVHSDYIRDFHSWISRAVASSATPLQRGDLLFAGSGETKAEIGKCVAFVQEGEAYAGGDIVILRPGGVDSTYLGFVLNTEAVNRQKASFGQGDAVVHISAKALAQVSVRIPSADEQAAIAQLLTDMDDEIAALEHRLEKTCAIKQGMMQQLLTGRVRLVPPATATMVGTTL